MLAGLLLFGLMGCDSMGSCAAKIAPPLEKINPSWGAEPVDCEDKRKAPKLKSGCSSMDLICKHGEEIIIEGTTKGGPKKFGDDFWQRAKCTTKRKNFENSPEAIYRLKIPPNTEAKIRLDRNCNDNMVPFAVAWKDERCPTAKHAEGINECEFPETIKDVSGKIGVYSNTIERITTVDKAQVFLVGVEGQRGAEGNFRLAIRCEPYR